jgi:hypothetical protein
LVKPTFEGLWNRIVHTLRPSQTVRSWGKARGYTGGTFNVEYIDQDGMTVSSARTSAPRLVGKDDFARVYEVWGRYLGGNMSRQELRDISHNTTYILSILKLIDDDAR